MTVKNYVWVAKAPLAKCSSLTTWMIKNDITALSTPLPTVLEDGDEGEYFDALSIFSDCSAFLYQRSRLRTWMLIKSLRLRITTTRQSHYKKVSRDVKNLIWSQYKHRKSQEKNGAM